MSFAVALRMGQLNMIQHNLTYETSARNARRLEKKRAKKMHADIITNITTKDTPPSTEKE